MMIDIGVKSGISSRCDTVLAYNNHIIWAKDRIFYILYDYFCVQNSFTIKKNGLPVRTVGGDIRVY